MQDPGECKTQNVEQAYRNSKFQLLSIYKPTNTMKQVDARTEIKRQVIHRKTFQDKDWSFSRGLVH